MKNMFNSLNLKKNLVLLFIFILTPTLLYAKDEFYIAHVFYKTQATSVVPTGVFVNHGTNSTNSIAVNDLSVSKNVYIIGAGNGTGMGNFAIEYRPNQSLLSGNLLQISFDGASFTGVNIKACKNSDASHIVSFSPQEWETLAYAQLSNNLNLNSSDFIYFTDDNCNGANKYKFPVKINATNTAMMTTITVKAFSDGNILFDSSTANLIQITGSSNNASNTTYNLNVNQSGTGSGIIISNPAGINCGNVCNATFNAGANVILTATASNNSIFAGWSGDCNGSASNCALTMNASKNVTATFNSTCTFTLSASPTTFKHTGGTGNINITPSTPTCNLQWNLSSNSNWINFCSSGANNCASNTINGTGGGNVTFKVNVNTIQQARTGTILLTSDSNNATTTITQNAAPACTYSITASPTLFSATAGTGIASITSSTPNCNLEWNLVSNNKWINFPYTCGSTVCLSNNVSGVGLGKVPFLIDANDKQLLRVGNIMLIENEDKENISQLAGSNCIGCNLTFIDTLSSWANQNIIALGCAGITQGCGENLYCPYDYVTREQMAAFIVRAKEGEPPVDYCDYSNGGIKFNDISVNNNFCKYIKRLNELQITQGCNNDKYCPNDYVTRGQMAAFIIRALYGENFGYTQIPYFSDVPETHMFFKYIQKMKDIALTTNTGVFDVNGYVTREMMAAFLYRAFMKNKCESLICNTANITAKVTDAITGETVSNVTVSTGDQIAITNTDGKATFNNLTASVNSNSQNIITIHAEQENYISQNIRTNIMCNKTTNVNMSLLPKDEKTIEGNIRIILTWDENPKYLDSHLTGPNINNTERFHIYSASKNNCNNNPCDATIPALFDINSTTGYGPNTITILKTSNNNFVPGVYRYSVHHRVGTKNIPLSNAIVRVYKGDVLIGTYTPPQPTSGQIVTNGWIWTVFEMNIMDNGAIIFNNIGTYSPPDTTTYLDN